MSFAAEELRIKTQTPEKQIEEIRRWAQKLIELLNYALNHLDDTNFNADLAGNVAGTEINEAVQEALDSNYKDLRSLTIARTKGSVTENAGHVVIGDAKVCWGTVEVNTVTENVAASVRVQFPFVYRNSPNVQVTVQNSDPGTRVKGCSSDNVTESDCDICVTRTNIGRTKASWLAFGK